jgi:hypothetical protein
VQLQESEAGPGAPPVGLLEERYAHLAESSPTGALPVGPSNNAWTITYTSSPCSSSAPFTRTIERGGRASVLLDLSCLNRGEETDEPGS